MRGHNHILGTPTGRPENLVTYFLTHIRIMNEQATLFFNNAKKWHDEYRLLREIIAENSSLQEDYKWMHPCYTFRGKNVVLIHGFKEYCALLFHKGVLIKDPDRVLIQQTENV